MFRRAYSAGFTQRPDPTVMGAFSGLEIACWDILGKARGRPVHALWGGRMRDRLRTYTYLYPEPGEDPAGFYKDPDASAACGGADGGGGLHRGEVRPGRALHHPRRPAADHGGPRPVRGVLPRDPRSGRATGPTCSSAPTASSPLRRDPPRAAYRALRSALVRGAGAAGPAARPRAGGGAVAGADRRRRAADHQGRVRDAAARRRRRHRAAEPRPGRRAARGAQGRGDRPRGSAPRSRRTSMPGRSPGRRRSSSRCRSRTSCMLESIGTGGGFHAGC